MGYVSCYCKWTLGPDVSPSDEHFSACLQVNCSVTCRASASPSVRLNMHKAMTESCVCSFCLGFGNDLYCSFTLIYSHFCYSKQNLPVVRNCLYKGFSQEEAVTHCWGSFLAPKSNKANLVSWALMTAQHCGLFTIQILHSLES